MDHRFQINLGGIIDLLSNHLYSGPEVYLRELLQNGVDAIRARQELEPGYAGSIEMEVIGGEAGPPTLLFVDDGIGLNESEVHAFLATIGETSKRSDLATRRSDYLGQFGIGLLSCFLVSDEIVVITRSAKAPDAPTIEWRGRPDGTYSLKTLEREIAAGTQVYLRAKPGFEGLIRKERVVELVRHFGGLLPCPIRLMAGGVQQLLNHQTPPWRENYGSISELHTALMDYGQDVFKTTFFDALPLRTDDGSIEGVAYVLPFRPTLAAQGMHRVYLKSMLVSQSAKNLVPEWAFFVKCLVDARDLRPTASRESLYEDEALEQARAALGGCLRRYLVDLSRKDAARWRRFLELHTLSIKALALQDDELYRLFIDWLPFETSLGDMTLAQVRERNGEVRYVTQVDPFRQIAQVAAAQDLCVVNGGYVYNNELLQKYPQVCPQVSIVEIDPSDLARSFTDLTEAEQSGIEAFVEVADDVLAAFRCAALVKRFDPAELPTLYTVDPQASFHRTLEQTKELADGAWGGVLGDLSSAGPQVHAQLCFNFNNPLVKSVIRQTERTLVQRCVQMLYVQALLLGHHPLSEREMRVLNEGLLGMIEWGLGKE